MKLLIVDDEELTRTGVISSVDWASLGNRPEIILCDVRMPRMDGITMLENSS